MNTRYIALNLQHISGPLNFFQPTQDLPGKVNLDSPAIMTMTDLRQVSALTVEPNVSIDWALARMREGGVRLLLVTNHGNDEVIGLITSTDIQGEKPVRLLRELNLRHSEIRVRDVMVSRDELEFIAYDDVLRASVGDVVETLRRTGRRHALVNDIDMRTGMQAVRGIFSATRLGQQLGMTFEPIEVATTFAEVEMAINAG
jgi:CBS domain containing-hemolysin-like protein